MYYRLVSTQYAFNIKFGQVWDSGVTLSEGQAKGIGLTMVI